MYSRISPVKDNVVTELAKSLGELLSSHNLVIDSRRVDTQSIFCAYPGSSDDGRRFIPDAIYRGAKFIVYESGIDLDITVAKYAVTDLMHYVGLLASLKYQNPSNKFRAIAVTGTNGKTSISHWLNQAYIHLDKKAAIIGTTGAGIYPQVKNYQVTTPDPITLQQLFFEFAKEQVDVLAMEVSSHALDQGRVNGTAFKSAIFTNLTQDHLDYHKTMEDYYLAKRKLFFWHTLENAIINVDDEYGKRLYNEVIAAKLGYTVLSYGINSGDMQASNIKIGLSGTSFTLQVNGQSQKVTVKAIGKFNVYNLLAVAATLYMDNYDLATIADIFSKLSPVQGRMETIIVDNQPLVVVDFSHTPDSLKSALSTLKEVEHSGKLYCVFGCGGNRDKTKRPIMGEIATTIADYSYITSDNPRYEEPLAIINEITSAIKLQNFTVIENRYLAIKKAIVTAKADDIILIAGKGHENYQEISGVKEPFSDVEVATEILAELSCN